MLTRLALLWLIFLSSAAHGAEWGAADTALLGSALGLLVVDWGQTRYIVKERAQTSGVHACVNIPSPCAAPEAPRKHYETNPFLGREPSIEKVDRYFAGAMLATGALSLVLPQTPRRWFLGGITFVEASVVIQNHGLGVRVAF